MMKTHLIKSEPSQIKSLLNRITYAGQINKAIDKKGKQGNAYNSTHNRLLGLFGSGEIRVENGTVIFMSGLCVMV